MTLEEENRQLKDARLCKVCMDDDVAVVFLPCGHLGKHLRAHSNVIWKRKAAKSHEIHFYLFIFQ